MLHPGESSFVQPSLKYFPIESEAHMNRSKKQWF